MIIGIDPGTTVAWAALDLEGRPLLVSSQRNGSASNLIAALSKKGRALIVGTDKAKCPSLVQEVATKLGGVVVTPPQDLKVEEKREMVRVQTANAHERDALASAQFAFKKMQPLLGRIRSGVERTGKQALFEDVAEIVIKEGVSIHAALAILEPEKEPVKEEAAQEQERDGDVVQLFKLLRHARKDNAQLAKRNAWLENRQRALERKVSSLEKRMEGLVKPKAPKELVRLKQKQINALSQKSAQIKSAQEKAQEQARELEKALLSPALVALPRLSHLGWDEVVKQKAALSDAVVFVDDPNKMSQKAVGFLQENGIELIVTPRLPTARAQEQLPFAFVKAKGVKTLARVALAKKQWLEKERKSKRVLSQIVSEYQRERAMSRRA